MTKTARLQTTRVLSVRSELEEECRVWWRHWRLGQAHLIELDRGLPEEGETMHVQWCRIFIWPTQCGLADIFFEFFLATSITLVTYFRAKDTTLVQTPTVICSLATLTIFIHMNSGLYWCAHAVH